MVTIQSLLDVESSKFDYDQDPDIYMAESVNQAMDVLIEFNEAMINMESTLDVIPIVKDEIQVEITLTMNHNINEIIDGVSRSFSDTVKKIITAIKDFFKSVINFFQTKIFKLDERLLKDNFKYIQAYYNDAGYSVTCPLTVYMVKNPFDEFVKDSYLLQDTVPAITREIQTLTNELRTTTNPGYLKEWVYALGKDEHNQALKNLQTEIFSKILPSLNQKMISERTIVSDIKSKYFSETKVREEQEVKDVITSSDVYSKLISRESFESFKHMKDTSEKCVADVLKNINSFDINQNTTVRVIPNRYDRIKDRIVAYRQLLSMLLRMSILYWELYSTFRTDCITAAKAIVATYK